MTSSEVVVGMMDDIEKVSEGKSSNCEGIWIGVVEDDNSSIIFFKDSENSGVEDLLAEVILLLPKGSEWLRREFFLALDLCHASYLFCLQNLLLVVSFSL